MNNNGWDFDGDSKKAEFTKFPVGITKIRVIDQAPSVRWAHWLNDARRSVNCPGKGCAICEIRKQEKANKMPYTYPMSRRFAINIENYETGKSEIMEQGIGFFEDLKILIDDLHKDGVSLNDAIIKIRRKGTTKDDTSYRLDVEEVKPLTDIEWEAINARKINLSEYFKPHTVEQVVRIVNGEKWEDVMKSSNADGDTDEDVTIV